MAKSKKSNFQNATAFACLNLIENKKTKKNLIFISNHFNLLVKLTNSLFQFD